MPKTTSRQGFTLVELIVTLAILIGIFGISIFIGINFLEGESLQTERANLLSALRKTRSEAINNINQSDHGVFITTSTYILFQGTSYVSRTLAYDEVFQMKGGITLNGVPEIIFKALEGNTNASGTITINKGDKSYNILVNYEGGIDW